MDWLPLRRSLDSMTVMSSNKRASGARALRTVERREEASSVISSSRERSCASAVEANAQIAATHTSAADDVNNVRSREMNRFDMQLSHEIEALSDPR